MNRQQWLLTTKNEKKENVRQTNKQDAGMSHDDNSSIYKLGKRKWFQLIVFVPFHRIYQGQLTSNAHENGKHRPLPLSIEGRNR